MTTYYHGGPAALTIILPREQTGARSPRSGDYSGWLQFFFPPDRVYLTTERLLADYYAAAWATARKQRTGTVYETDPVGDLDIDWDEPRAFTADSARIRRVAGTVPATRIAELSKKTYQWRASQPPVLQTTDQAVAYFDRIVERAVRRGWDPQTVTTMIVNGGMRRRFALDIAGANLRDKVAQAGIPTITR